MKIYVKQTVTKKREKQYIFKLHLIETSVIIYKRKRCFMNKKVIGVFDSGVGGIVVLNELVKALPNEEFLYVADEQNSPYGEKTKEEVREIVSKNCNYLYEKNSKMIVIACNTATANSDHIKLDIPIIGVIETTAKQVYELPKNSNVLLVATNVTVNSKSYQNYLKDYNVFSIGAPEFVKIVEENLYSTQEAKTLVFDKLSKFQKEDIKAVILGCTHFELLKDFVQEVFPKAKVYSSSKVMADEVKNTLIRKRMLETNNFGKIIIESNKKNSNITDKISWFEREYIFKTKK